MAREHKRIFVKIVPDCMYCFKRVGEYYCQHCAALVCKVCPCYCCPVCDTVLDHPLPEHCPKCNVIVAEANKTMPHQHE